MFNKRKIYLIPIIGFLIIIFFVSVLLYIPMFNNKQIEYKDALFIATSSVTTTGLLKVPISEQFNFWGQLIIAISMEVGAYGFIVIIYYVLSIRNKKIGFSDMILINDNINSDDFSSIKEHLLFIGKLMIKVQIIGAIFYSIKFIPYYGFLKGIWYSIFHSISAFSNGGIDILGSENFIWFKNDIYIQIVTIVLMFLGSLGILVIEDLGKNKRKRFNRLKLQSQIVLVISITMIIIPTIIIFMLEPNLNFVNSLFTSISIRSTGFIIYPTVALSGISKIILMILMFIGGGPASTSGGIKILPFSIVIATIIATLKGRDQTIIFNRKIPEFLIKKSFVIFILFILILFISSSSFYILNDIGIFEIIFECSSAITNAGLTIADYSQINFAGEIILMILMFIGRVGPLSMFLVFMKDNKKGKNIEYPEANIVI